MRTVATRTSYIRARIDPQLKNEVASILSRLGTTPSEVINMLFAQIRERKAIPFEVALPNEETLKAVSDVRKKKNLVEYAGAEEMLGDLKR